MQHSYEKLPDKHIEGIGNFEVEKCTICGVKRIKGSHDGAITSYFKDGSVLTLDPGCNE